MDTSLHLPLWKKILFAVMAAALFFAVIESSLALIGIKTLFVTEDPFVGFSENIPLFVKQTLQDGTVMLITSEKRRTAFNVQQFPKEKKKGTYRIFCLGGSTTYGHPYSDSTSFCGWLREFLRAADPSTNWEVINVGGISYASYRVVNLMQELSGYQPDLFIVYSGQNEFLEERTYRNIKEIPPWLMRTHVVLSKTRTYTAMHRVLNAVTGKKPQVEGLRDLLSGEETAVLNTIGPSYYHRDDDLKEEVMEQYRYNLEHMTAIARSAGSKIMFVTPASNLKDIKPFKSENRPDLTKDDLAAWAALYGNGKELQSAGKLAEALAVFHNAMKIDDRFADLCFRVGQMYFGLKRYAEAKESFQRALDNDIVPLRILSPMGMDVRKTTRRLGVPLIDFEKLLEDDCYRRYGHRVLGDEYFLDHVHPTIEGNRMLGLAILEQMAASGILKPGPAWGESAKRAVTKKVTDQIGERQRVYAFMVLGNTYIWAGCFDKAYEALLQASRLEKDGKVLGPIYDSLARAASELGKIDEAIVYSRNALKYTPDTSHAHIHFNLAAMLQLRGRPDEALHHYSQVIRIVRQANRLGITVADFANIDPVEMIVNAQESSAKILAVQGRIDEAVKQYNELLKIRPDDSAAHASIAPLLARLGRKKESDFHLAEARRLNARDQDGRK